MKNIIIFFCLLICFSVQGQTNKNSECTNIYLIRHAEKDRTNKNNTNPHLNSLGIKRSFKWKEFFKNIEQKIYKKTSLLITIEEYRKISGKLLEKFILNLGVNIFDPSSSRRDDWFLIHTADATSCNSGESDVAFFSP